LKRRSRKVSQTMLAISETYVRSIGPRGLMSSLKASQRRSKSAFDSAATAAARTLDDIAQPWCASSYVEIADLAAAKLSVSRPPRVDFGSTLPRRRGVLLALVSTWPPRGVLLNATMNATPKLSSSEPDFLGWMHRLRRTGPAPPSPACSSGL
jgi:hypothetical protein